MTGMRFGVLTRLRALPDRLKLVVIWATVIVLAAGTYALQKVLHGTALVALYAMMGLLALGSYLVARRAASGR